MKVIRIDSGMNPFAASLVPDSAIRPDRRPLFLPEGKWKCEIRMAVRVSRLGKMISYKFAPRYYADFAFVNCLLPADGSGFRFDIMDDAIVLGQWEPIESAPGEVCFDGSCGKCHLSREEIDRYIVDISAKATFKTGDIIILPTPIFAFEPQIGQHVELSLPGDTQPLLQFNIK